MQLVYKNCLIEQYYKNYEILNMINDYKKGLPIEETDLCKILNLNTNEGLLLQIDSRCNLAITYFIKDSNQSEKNIYTEYVSPQSIFLNTNNTAFLIVLTNTLLSMNYNIQADKYNATLRLLLETEEETGKDMSDEHNQVIYLKKLWNPESFNGNDLIYK